MATATPPTDQSQKDELDMSPSEMTQKFLSNARTLRDFTALTPDSMEVIYSLAYNHYNAGKYEDAEKVFHMLCSLDHFERKYWKGLGACRDALGQHETALQAYGYLGMMDIHDPYPAFKAAQCFLALGKRAEAESGLRAAVYNSAGKAEHAELHQQAKALLEIVEAHARNHPAPAAPSAS